MQSITAFFLVFLAVSPCFSQRPFYAGRLPGAVSSADLTNLHVSELPAQLNGDVAYANRLQELPENQQPIWFLNQKAYADLLKHPQTYPQRPSPFNENAV